MVSRRRRRRLERRGRPKRADAKRRATTTSGRRGADDPGSPELVRRKIAVANGSAVAVELIDVVGVLFANELILEDELVALRTVAGWLHQLRRTLQLAQASPGGLWAAIVSATGLGTITMPASFGGDRALFRLSELYAHFAAIGRLEVLQLAVRIAGNEAPPTTAGELARLREAARIVMAVQRRGRSASKAT